MRFSDDGTHVIGLRFNTDDVSDVISSDILESAADYQQQFVYLPEPTNELYFSDGTNWRAILITNSDGDVVANIVPRTDTLANLLTVVGSNGELASATDTNAIVQFNGLSAPGTVYYPYDPVINNDYSDKCGQIFTLNLLNTINNPIATLTMQNKVGCLIGFINAAKTSIYLSWDGLKYFKGVAAPSTSNYALTIGNYLIAVPVASATEAYFTSSPFSTWTTYSTALDSIVYSAPIVIGEAAVLSVRATSEGAGTESVILGVAAGEVYKPALPSSQIWLVPVSPGWAANISTKVFALSLASGTSTAALLAGTKATATWVEVTLPATVSSTSIITYTKTKIVIYTPSSNSIMTASYDREAGTIGTWSVVAIPTTNLKRVVSNLSLFFCCETTPSSYVYVSADGISWTRANITDTTNDIYVSYSGMLYRASDGYSYFVSNKNKVTLQQISATPIYKMPYTDGFVYPNSSLLSKLLTFIPVYERLPGLYTSAGTGTINISENAKNAIITTATQEALTVNLPPNPVNNQEIAVKFNNTHTALTIGTQSAPELTLFNGVAAQYTITPAVAAGQVFRFVFSMSGNSWYLMS